jgi:cystathionine gamma-synthase
VYYPKFQTPGEYRAFRKPAGGYGGLLSLVLKDAPAATPRFFDALRVSKGPNLGTNYTLACPYTILAHYGELEFAESCGVSRHLVRVSVGLEDPDDLRRRFTEALAGF